MDVGYRTKDGITVLEGLMAVRHRPAMYIGAEEPGHSLPTRILEFVADGVAHDTPTPEEVRILLWREGAITVAYDGAPIPIEPFSRPVNGVEHPAFYQFFMYLFAGADPFHRSLAFGAILNALSEQLVVSTMHGGDRYRAVFSQGMIVSLLTRTHCASPLGTTWVTGSRSHVAQVIGKSSANSLFERLRPEIRRAFTASGMVTAFAARSTRLRRVATSFIGCVRCAPSGMPIGPVSR